MKEKLHPKYHHDAKVVCSCGNTFITGSTRQLIKVEVCGRCHPFYTGEQRIRDTGGRVERFKRRFKTE
ncbi:MAG: 50S ribosomal protein L31 [Chloroflexi bacterium]|nr:50S ribosomal protein L31 [Chloroflexota bacterium]